LECKDGAKKEEWLVWAYLPLIDFKHRTAVCNRQLHSRSHHTTQHRPVWWDVIEVVLNDGEILAGREMWQRGWSEIRSWFGNS